MVLASFDISNTPMRSCHSPNLIGRKDAFVMRSAASVIYLYGISCICDKPYSPNEYSNVPYPSWT